MPTTPTGNISQIQLPDGNVYSVKDTVSNYTDTVVTVSNHTLFIASSIQDADNEEF